MNLFETIEKRRSVRKYLNAPVPRPVMEKAIEAALLAPNSSNLQPWEFYWVTQPEKKKQLVTACLDQATASTAAELVVFVARTDTWRRNRQLILENLGQRGTVPKQQLDYYQKIVPLFYTPGWFSSLGLLKSMIFSVVGLFRPVPRGPFSKSGLRATLSKTVALACENFMLAIAGFYPMDSSLSCCVSTILESQPRSTNSSWRKARTALISTILEPQPQPTNPEKISFR